MENLSGAPNIVYFFNFECLEKMKEENVVSLIFQKKPRLLPPLPPHPVVSVASTSSPPPPLLLAGLRDDPPSERKPLQ